MARRRPESTPLSRKLVAAIRAAGWEPYGNPERYFIRRVYAGYWQRSHGAWSWALDYLDDDTNCRVDAASIGSQWPATMCARGCEFVGSGLYPTSLAVAPPPSPNGEAVSAGTSEDQVARDEPPSPLGREEEMDSANASRAAMGPLPHVAIEAEPSGQVKP